MHNDQTRNDTLQDRGSQAVEGRESIQHEIGEISNLIIRDGSKFSNTQTGNLVYKDDIDWARSAYPMHPPSHRIRKIAKNRLQIITDNGDAFFI